MIAPSSGRLLGDAFSGLPDPCDNIVVKPLTFAVAGDVHGAVHSMVRLVAGLADKVGRALGFVL